MIKFTTSRLDKSNIITALDSKNWDELEKLLIDRVRHADVSFSISGPGSEYWKLIVSHLRRDTWYAPFVDNDIRAIPYR